MITDENTTPVVDSIYYLTEYHGTMINPLDFPSYEIDAEAYVNQITFGRVKKFKVVPREVKNAICAVCEVMARQHELQKQNIHSENNDGYSVTFASPLKESEYRTEMYSNVKMWLSGTGLMYKGRSCKYDY